MTGRQQKIQVPTPALDYEICCRRLKNLFHSCPPGDDCDKIYTIVSCLLTSRRPLKLAEITTIVGLLQTPANSDACQLKSDFGLNIELFQHKGGVLLNLNQDGNVEFAHPLFVDIFKNCAPLAPYVSLDGTKIATACLIQIEQDEVQQSTSLHASSFRSPFSIYAHRFWTDHYHPLQVTRSALTSRLDKMILDSEHAAETLESSTTQVKIKRALDFCEKRNFHVLRGVYQQLLQHAPQTYDVLGEAPNFSSASDMKSFDNCLGQLSLEETTACHDKWVLVQSSQQERFESTHPSSWPFLSAGSEI